MPTTYTHDKFGKDVYKKLPEHIKAVSRKGKGLYRIGQHGPDIFFYYKPVRLPQSGSIRSDRGCTRTGVWILPARNPGV